MNMINISFFEKYMYLKLHQLHTQINNYKQQFQIFNFWILYFGLSLKVEHCNRQKLTDILSNLDHVSFCNKNPFSKKSAIIINSLLHQDIHFKLIFILNTFEFHYTLNIKFFSFSYNCVHVYMHV